MLWPDGESIGRHFAQRLYAASAALNRLAMNLAIAAVVLLVVMASWQAAARYLLDVPPAWTEELARYLMVWAGLLGASCAFHQHADPTLFPAGRSYRGRGHRWRVLVRMLGALVFVSPIIWYCIWGLNGQLEMGYVARNARMTAETLGLPMWVFALAVPVGFGLIFIHAIAHACHELTSETHT